MTAELALARREFRATDWKVQGNPFDPKSGSSIIKPGELIDVIEVTPLTLTESRIYDLLIANAWDRITEPVVHKIKKADLRGAHESNDRLETAIETMMGALAVVQHVVDGKPRRARVQLLGANSEEIDARGYIYYKFPDELRQIIGNSSVFARLRTRIIYAFQCKYALKLYEVVEKRAQLRYKQHEYFEVNDFRSLLGVAPKKLKRFADLHRYALRPTLREVNGLTDYAVEIGMIKKGKRVQQLLLTWGKKASMRALRSSRSLTSTALAGPSDWSAGLRWSSGTTDPPNFSPLALPRRNTKSEFLGGSRSPRRKRPNQVIPLLQRFRIRLRPSSVGEGDEPAGVGDQLVPGLAAGVDHVPEVVEHAVGEVAAAEVPPHQLHRVQCRAVGRQRQQAEVGRDLARQRLGPVVAGAVAHHHGVGAGRDPGADRRQGQGQRLGRGHRQHQARGGAAPGAHGADQGGRLEPAAPRPARPAAPGRPDPGQRARLADPPLVLEPDRDRRAGRQARGLLAQRLREV
jgi:hypothetical protein